MHAKNPDREIRRKIQEIGEKHYIETFEKSPPSGGFRGDFYFSFFCRAFCSSFYQKKSCFPASGLGDGQTNAQRCWAWYTTNMTNRTFLTYHFYTKKRGKIITFFVLKNISSRHPGQVFLYMSAHRFICVIINYFTKHHQETLSPPLSGDLGGAFILIIPCQSLTRDNSL